MRSASRGGADRPPQEGRPDRRRDRADAADAGQRRLRRRRGRRRPRRRRWRLRRPRRWRAGRRWLRRRSPGRRPAPVIHSTTMAMPTIASRSSRSATSARRTSWATALRRPLRPPEGRSTRSPSTPSAACPSTSTRASTSPSWAPSGSGKSTMLNLLGCLDRPTSGEYFLGDDDVAQLDDDELSEVRSRYIGFIFQSYNLIQQYTVIENIQLPLTYQGSRRDLRGAPAADRSSWPDGRPRRPPRPPAECSSPAASSSAWRSPGRSINDPYIILADEATGNLDTATSDEIMDDARPAQRRRQDDHHGHARGRHRRARQADHPDARRRDHRRRPEPPDAPGPGRRARPPSPRRDDPAVDGLRPDRINAHRIPPKHRRRSEPAPWDASGAA